MRNIQGRESHLIRKIYDIKGSTLGRWNNDTKGLSVLKDRNFLESPKDRLKLSKKVKAEFFE
jgi:hypothetical protein